MTNKFWFLLYDDISFFYQDFKDSNLSLLFLSENKFSFMLHKYRLSLKKLFIAGFILFFCLGLIFAQKDITIEGRLENIQTSSVELLQLVPNAVLATASVSDERKFKLSADITGESIYQLNFAEGKYLMLILSPGDNVNITVDGNAMSFPEITGSKHSEKLYNTIREYHLYDRKIEEYRKKMLNEKQAFIERFLQNDTSLATLFFGDRVPIAQNIEIYQKTLENLQYKYPDNYFVNDLEKRINSHALLAVNSKMPEIALPNPQGDTLKLSDYRGDIVLVDFWASWCGPCRQANPHLVSLYEKYRDQGFEIFGVSLDRSRDAWLKGIEGDNLTWPQVSDLKYWNSSVVKDFGISGIPFTVLVDKDGTILAKGLRGQELENRLDRIFTNSEN